MKDEEIHILPSMTTEQMQKRASAERKAKMHSLSETALADLQEKLNAAGQKNG